MTKAQFRKLLAAVVARSVRAGPSLSIEARTVLLAMLQRGADGSAPAGSSVLSAELGLGERSLRRAMVELQDCGFVFRDADPEDGRRTVFVPNGSLLRAWADGNYEPASLGLADGEETENEIAANNDVNLRFEGAEGSGEVDCVIGRDPRVRAAMSSSSSSFPSSPRPLSPLSQAAMPATSQEAHAEHEAMVAALRRWGIPTPAGAQQYAWNWVGRWTVSQVSQAAEAAWRAGAKNVQYLEAVLSSDAAEAAYPVHSKVRRFEDFRGLRPWHGGPNPETAPMGAQDEVN